MILKSRSAVQLAAYLFAVCAFASVIVLVSNTAGNAMADELRSIDLKPFGPGYAGAEALRAVRRNGGAFLFVSVTTTTPPLGAQTTFAALDAANQGAGWRNVAAIHQIVPARLAWDVAADSRGQFQIVYERPGGAINALELRGSTGETRLLTSGYPMQSFSLPNFETSSGEPPVFVTAIVDNRTCVALPLTQAPAYRELGECAEGLVVKDGPGFVFFLKKAVPGNVRGNSIAPGRLTAIALGPDLRPSGRTGEVLAAPIFQFDAATVGGKLVVVATTEKGFVVASTLSGQLHLNRVEYAAAATLVYPTIVAGASGKSLFCALDGAGSAKAQVVGAGIAIP
jgi:hypothetical protein